MRGRHSMISAILSTQKMRNIDHACRLQFTSVANFAVRRLKDWLVILEEFTAAVDAKVLQKMYDIATPDPYGFLFIDLKNNNFYRSFKSELKAN